MANLIAIHAIGVKDKSRLVPIWDYANPGAGYTPQHPGKLIQPGTRFPSTELEGGDAEGARLVASGAARWA
jgi:hypothetical protein